MPEENTHNSFLVVLPSTTTPNAPQTTPFLFLFLLFLFRHFTPRPLFGPFPGDGDDCGNFERFSRPENSLHRQTNSQNLIKRFPPVIFREKTPCPKLRETARKCFPCLSDEVFFFLCWTRGWKSTQLLLLRPKRAWIESRTNNDWIQLAKFRCTKPAESLNSRPPFWMGKRDGKWVFHPRAFSFGILCENCNGKKSVFNSKRD